MMADRYMPAAVITVLALVTGEQNVHASEKTSDLFLLEDHFVGELTARGAFESKIAKVNRPFSVKTRGTWNGKTLTLVEDFFYDDGEKDRKTWRFTKTGPDTYEGTREDVVGKARIKSYPGRLTLKYLVDIPRGDGKIRVRFSDIISMQEDGSIRNVARVSKFGFKIGSVDLTFTR
ncbi:MAG: DUF3833 family protein [Pseudomonadota bacterium]